MTDSYEEKCRELLRAAEQASGWFPEIELPCDFEGANVAFVVLSESGEVIERHDHALDETTARNITLTWDKSSLL